MRFTLLFVCMACTLGARAITAVFDMSVTSGCAPLVVKFTDKSTGGAVKWEWDLGNGNKSGLRNPSGIYGEGKVYKVTLVVYDGSGNSATITKDLTVHTPPKADFKADHSGGCIPFSVQFRDLSVPGTSATSSWLWDFGDGILYKGSIPPVHVYKTAGNFDVTLMVTDPNGCSNTFTRKAYITTAASPIIDFTASDSAECGPPLTVAFTSKVKNLAGSTFTYLWELGDGTTSTDPNPIHTYRGEDVFTVSLTVTDAKGCSSTKTITDYIQLFKPAAQFNPVYKNGCPRRTVAFLNTSYPTPKGTKWEWDFGDGYVSDTMHPTHTYTESRDYYPRLIVTNLAGCKDTAYRKVTVYSGKEGERPEADFIAFPTRGCAGDMRVMFFEQTGKTGMQADSFWWDFGDGGLPSHSSNPERTFRYPGYYAIRLHASTQRCTDTIVKQDYIEVLPPMARFGVFNPCNTDSLKIIDASIGATEYFYDFGDGTTSKEKNPVHVYKKSGIHWVTQVVYNNITNCRDTVKERVQIAPFTSDIFADPEQGCAPLEVAFFARVSHETAKYRWLFGDGSDTTGYSDSFNIKHEFQKPGVYNVKLIVGTPNGCFGINGITIRVYGHENKFTAYPLEGCAPLTITLIDSAFDDPNIIKREYEMGDGTTLPCTARVMKYTYKTVPENQEEGYRLGFRTYDGLCEGYDAFLVYPTGPDASIRAQRTNFCGSVRYWFDPMIKGRGPFKVHWRCSDGTESKKEIFQKIFTQEGTYTVSLVATDGNGCSDSVSITVKIKIRYPRAKFSVSATAAACPPLAVDFTDQSIEGNVPFTKWEWHFGDGSTSYERHPKKLFNIPGKFIVKLIVTDSVGCKDSFTYATSLVVNGPVGSYRITKTDGCVPVTVKFEADSKDATGIIWDLGNGIPDTNRTLTYTYTKPGMYIPALILIRETSGDTCVYSLPRMDTIFVAPIPKLDFSFSGDCFGYPSVFSSDSSSSLGTVKNLAWDFGDGKGSGDYNPDHIYEKPGWYSVKLFVSNEEGCESSITKKIKIGGLDAKFSTSSHGACIGDPVKFTDKTFADTAILSREWDFGDGNRSSIPNPVHTYLEKGLYRVIYRVTDYKGCSDTMVIPEFAVGDHSPPAAPHIYRVTVDADNTVRLEFSKYQDIDLAYYIISREGPNGFQVIDSVKEVNDTVYLDKTADAVKGSYCYRVKVKTFCNFFSSENKAHCSVNLKGLPAVNSSVLAWNAYTGWEVEQYEVYRQDVYNPGTFIKLGTVDANTFSFIDSAIICYRTHHYRIKAFEKGGLKQVSWSNTTEVTPNYIPDVPSNNVIRATVENNRDVLVQWSGLAEAKVKYYVLERSEDGIKYKTLGNTFSPFETDFVDRKVSVSEKSYYYRTRVIDSCGDAGPYSNLGRTILLKADTTPDLFPNLYWNRYIRWPEGVKHYDLELKDANGIFCKMVRTGESDTSYVDKLTDFNSLKEYCYRVTAYRGGTSSNPDANIHVTSTSNEACVPARSLLWIPNAFTPNGDKLNDEFLVKAMYISKFSMLVFDRWGTRVFETDKLTEGWDGRYKNGIPLLDAYRYLIVAQGVDGAHHYRHGWVTLVR